MNAKRIITAILLLALVCALTIIAPMGAFAEESEPKVSIERFNLSFNENIYIKYAVSFEGVDPSELDEGDVGMLFWTSPQERYEKDNAESISTDITYDSGVKYYIFAYTDLAAKQMTDDIYSRAYFILDGEIYYSDVEQYSILRYAYNKLGYSIGSTASTNQKLKDLLSSMLEYGAMAQSYFNYKADRPANASFYDVNVSGGLVADTGMTGGLYVAGDKVTLSAPETNADGWIFSHWEDKSGTEVATTTTFELTVGAANEVYTPIYTEPVYSKGLKFTSNGDGTCYVSGIGTCTDTDVVIPSKSPAGDTVTSIGYEAFYECTRLTRIEIPSSVTSIGDSAFNGCSGLTSIEIPSSVTSIGDWAFAYCFGLTSIEIPSSVTSIGNRAFSDCRNLESITVAEGNTVYHSAGNCIIETATKTLIAGCKTSVIPSDGSVTSIGDGAFNGCDGLTSIEIPSSVTRIGDFAFYGCSGLTSIEIPSSVTSIGYRAFAWCDGLTSIEIPSSVTSIGDRAFGRCASLESITVEEENSVYHSAGNCIIETATKTLIAGCKTSVIPSDGSVTSIGNDAFHGCNELTSIEIPSSVTSIGEYAFCLCEELTSIEIPSSVTSIGVRAFAWCDGLEKITILSSTVEIYDNENTISDTATIYGYAGSTAQAYAEKYDREFVEIKKTSSGLKYTLKSDDTYEVSGIGTCTDTDIVIPSTYEGKAVTSIGDWAFLECYKLTSIEIPSSVTSICHQAFGYCSSLTSVTIPDSVTSIDSSAFSGCDGLESITVSEGNAVYHNAGNCIIETATKTLIAGCKTSVIPTDGSVTIIGEQAFMDCTGLTSIDIPSSVISIGGWAFYACNGLESITVAEGNTVYHSAGNCLIETSTKTLIAGCKTSVIPSDGSVTSIEDWAFSWCTGLTSIDIPSNVTSIGDWAFSCCTELKGIKIPSSVTSIGDGAFAYCENLTTIYYGGTETQWNAISKDSNWDQDTGDYTLIVHTHTVYEWEETKAPTCTEAGDETGACSSCGEAITRVVAALGHDIVNGACTRCDYEETVGDTQNGITTLNLSNPTLGLGASVNGSTVVFSSSSDYATWKKTILTNKTEGVITIYAEIAVTENSFNTAAWKDLISINGTSLIKVGENGFKIGDSSYYNHEHASDGSKVSCVTITVDPTTGTATVSVDQPTWTDRTGVIELGKIGESFTLQFGDIDASWILKKISATQVFVEEEIPTELLTVGPINYAGWEDGTYNEYVVNTNGTENDIVIVFDPARNNYQTIGNNLLSVNGTSVISMGTKGGYILGATNVDANYSANPITVIIDVKTGDAVITDTQGNSGTANVGAIGSSFILKINQSQNNSWELKGLTVTQSNVTESTGFSVYVDGVKADKVPQKGNYVVYVSDDENNARWNYTSWNLTKESDTATVYFFTVEKLYESVEDMQNDAYNLSSGDIVGTMSYYAGYDRGAAIYEVGSNYVSESASKFLSSGIYATIVPFTVGKDSIITVDQFEAHGDGITCDTHEIISAISYPYATVVEFESTSYLQTYTITLSNIENKTINGRGAYIFNEYSSVYWTDFNMVESSNVTVKNLELRCTETTGLGILYQRNDHVQLYLGTSSNIVFDNMIIYAPNNSNEDKHITSVWMQPGNNGVTLQNSTIKNLCNSTVGGGIWISGSDNVKILNNYIEKCSRDETIACFNGSCDTILIEGNYIYTHDEPTDATSSHVIGFSVNIVEEQSRSYTNIVFRNNELDVVTKKDAFMFGNVNGVEIYNNDITVRKNPGSAPIEQGVFRVPDSATTQSNVKIYDNNIKVYNSYSVPLNVNCGSGVTFTNNTYSCTVN